MKVFMRLSETGSDTIGFALASREMNNFDNWIRITYALSGKPSNEPQAVPGDGGFYADRDPQSFL
jgi:hypothetical protein